MSYRSSHCHPSSQPHSELPAAPHTRRRPRPRRRIQQSEDSETRSLSHSRTGWRRRLVLKLPFADTCGIRERPLLYFQAHISENETGLMGRWGPVIQSGRGRPSWPLAATGPYSRSGTCSGGTRSSVGACPKIERLQRIGFAPSPARSSPSSRVSQIKKPEAEVRMITAADYAHNVWGSAAH